MTLISLIFYAFSALLIASGGMVIIARNPVHSALFLVLAFFATAGLWMLLEAEFLALILILVYVGAVMTLFLFVVMTLNLDTHGMRSPKRYLPIGLLIVAILTSLMIYVATPYLKDVPAVALASADHNNTLILGQVLYTHYVFPFEVAGALLLVAIVAAITLSARVIRNRKVQNPEAQIAVKREDRVRLVKL
ncbi:MAG: NADH-quinone oxidoreductase subunit J [Gammaproteobacteria bacterium]